MAISELPTNYTNDRIEAEIADKAEKEGDEWRIRVMRRMQNGELSHLCTLSSALSKHMTFPDTWLPRFAGGGEYRLQAFHHSSPNKAFSGVKTVRFDGQARAPDFEALRAQDWDGPKDVITRMDRSPEQIPSTYNPSADGGGLASLTQARAVPPSAGTSPDANYVLSRERALMDRERALDMKGIEAKHELEMRRLEARIAEQSKPPPPGPDFGAMFREMTALMMAMQEKSDARTERLLATLSAKDAVSPIIEKMLDRQMNAADAAQKSAMGLNEMMTSSMRNQMQLAQTFNEMIRKDTEPAEEGIGPILRSVVEGLANASANRKDEAEAKAAEALARRDVNARAELARREAAARARLPAAVVKPKAVAPTPAIVPPPAPVALAEVPTPEEPELTVLEELDEMIHGYDAPEEVVGFLIENIEDPEVVVDLKKHNMKLMQWLTARYGDWANGEGQKAIDYALQLKAVAEMKFKEAAETRS